MEIVWNKTKVHGLILQIKFCNFPWLCVQSSSVLRIDFQIIDSIIFLFFLVLVSNLLVCWVLRFSLMNFLLSFALDQTNINTDQSMTSVPSSVSRITHNACNSCLYKKEKRVGGLGYIWGLMWHRLEFCRITAYYLFWGLKVVMMFW